jgi:hypothetical protein
MREAALRSVLIVKAIEETEGTEFLIPEADRKAAAREARRDAGASASADESTENAALPRRAQRMLAARADVLLAPVIGRHPFIESVSKLASGPTSIGWALVALSVLFGGALSALDGRGRIDLLSLPLLGVVAWNLLVYAAVVWSWLRSTSKKRAPRRLLPALVTQRILASVKRFVDRSANFNAPLAEALDRFTREWSEVAKPLLLARASRVFHLCAAAAGIGLIAGLYLRAITLDYSAGWQSTFLDADDVHTLLSIVYGPASAVTGIGIPDVSRIAAIRWHDGIGGERAANWIHLLTATIVLFVVLPRLALVLLGTMTVWRWSLHAALPPSLTAYFMKTFGGDGVLVHTAVTVIPYAYDPSQASVNALRRLLVGALGGEAAIDVRLPVQYGDEETALRSIRESRGPDAMLVLLLNLAATPEDENHGVVIAGALKRRETTKASEKLLVLVDEGPYAGRMGAIGGAHERLAERRRSWQAFTQKHGLKPHFVNLAAPADDPAAPAQDTQAERLRAHLTQSG